MQLLALIGPGNVFHLYVFTYWDSANIDWNSNNVLRVTQISIFSSRILIKFWQSFHDYNGQVSPGGPLKYNSVHMRDQKNAWKGYFFHRKARNARDVLRVWKTVFLEEKGTFEICLSREKGTIFSQTFLPDLYVSALNTQLN